MKEKFVAATAIAALGAAPGCAHIKTADELDSELVGRTNPSRLVTTPDPGKVVDRELARIAREVAHCAFEHEPDGSHNWQLHKWPVNVAELEEQPLDEESDALFSIEAVNFVEGTEIQLPTCQKTLEGPDNSPVPVDTLHLDIFPEGEYGHKGKKDGGPKMHFRDLGLDGNVDVFDRDVKAMRDTPFFKDNRRLSNPNPAVSNPHLAEEAQAKYRKALLAVHRWCINGGGGKTGK